MSPIKSHHTFYAESVLTLFLLLSGVSAFSQNLLIQNAGQRISLSLNGKWNYIIDPYEMGYYDYRARPYDENPKPQDRAYFTNTKPKDRTERIEYDFDRSPTLLVPGDWNSQEEKLLYYEGTIWYKKSFDYKKSASGNRVFVHFGAVNYRADVYLNGKKLGFHKGGFTPFNFEITDLVKEKDNFLIVKVNNTRKAEEVPTLNTDWWNYGGITRDVSILESPATFVSDYSLQLKKGSFDILCGYVKMDGPAKGKKEVLVEIPGAGITRSFVSDNSGYAPVEIRTPGLHLWSPGDPFLYDVKISTTGDQVSDRIGFRMVETRGTEILLNGNPVFLKGISIHEENAIRGGRAYSREDARMLLTWARELGCNFVRLAHYPHNENMPRLADEMGIMVWEENPVYWTIQWTNPETFKTASGQLREVISRDKNRASVIIWSMANETPVIPERLTFLKNLADTARSMDQVRLISAALEQHGMPGNELVRIIEDPFAQYVDLVSFNEYIGWYDGLPDKCEKIEWKIDYKKPVFISEFGADALGGFHGDSLTRWSEEYQEYYYRQTLKMISGIPGLRGISPWILVDFRSPRRVLPGIQDGWNRKGVISETGDRKKAFYVLRSYYKAKESQVQRPDDLDIYLLIGQSNMAGRAPILAADSGTLANVYLFRGDSIARWEPAANPLNRYSTIRRDRGEQQLGPGWYFAKSMEEAHPGTRVGLVVNARGGTSIDRWAADSLYFKEAVKRAREASGSGTLKAILWHQGESDVKRYKEYPAKITRLIEALRSELGMPGIPFIAGELAEEKPNRDAFNRMLKETLKEIPNTAVVSSAGLTTYDSTHFDSRSMRIFGERYADETLRLLKTGIKKANK